MVNDRETLLDSKIKSAIRGLSKKYPTIFFPAVINGETVGETERSGRRDFHAHA